MKITLNPDREIVETVKKGLEAKYGEVAQQLNQKIHKTFYKGINYAKRK